MHNFANLIAVQEVGFIKIFWRVELDNSSILEFETAHPAAILRAPASSLDGIAYDAAGRRLFVTGKLWPKVFQIRLNPRPPGTQ